MESSKIETLLEIYFEGNTTLEQEKMLREYFSSRVVADHLESHKPLFAAFSEAKLETSQREISLSKKQRTSNFWKYGIAAMFTLIIGVTAFFLSQSGHTQEEKEALAAFEKSKEIMYLLSSNLNQGAEKLEHVSQFTITKNEILK